MQSNQFESMTEISHSTREFPMKVSLQPSEQIIGITYSLLAAIIPPKIQTKSIIQKPSVRVEIDNGIEYIFYDEKRMIENKPYPVKFYGVDIFIIKRKNKIEMVDRVED